MTEEQKGDGEEASLLPSDNADDRSEGAPPDASSPSDLAGAESTVEKQHDTASKARLERSPSSAHIPVELLECDQYEVLEQIGSGGMGVVYRARNLHMGGRLEALKVLNRLLVEDPEAKERFEREIAVVGRLSGHPNIVTAHHVLRFPSLLVLTMEYVDGLDLHRYVTRDGIPRIDQACEFIRQAAEGLQYANENGIVHRDIKPANLMVTRRGLVKILDFGLGKIQQDQIHSGMTQTGSGMGTPHYVAPEQLDDAAHVDIRADVYSLGCTAFYLLAGRPPFAGSQRQVYAALATHQATPDLSDFNSNVSRSLADVVAKMTAMNPDARYQTPQQVIDALDALARSGSHPTPFFPTTHSKPTSTELEADPRHDARPATLLEDTPRQHDASDEESPQDSASKVSTSQSSARHSSPVEAESTPPTPTRLEITHDSINAKLVEDSPPPKVASLSSTDRYNDARQRLKRVFRAMFPWAVSLAVRSLLLFVLWSVVIGVVRYFDPPYQPSQRSAFEEKLTTYRWIPNAEPGRPSKLPIEFYSDRTIDRPYDIAYGLSSSTRWEAADDTLSFVSTDRKEPLRFQIMSQTGSVLVLYAREEDETLELTRDDFNSRFRESKQQYWYYLLLALPLLVIVTFGRALSLWQWMAVWSGICVYLLLYPIGDGRTVYWQDVLLFLCVQLGLFPLVYVACMMVSNSRGRSFASVKHQFVSYLRQAFRYPPLFVSPSAVRRDFRKGTSTREVDSARRTKLSRRTLTIFGLSCLPIFGAIIFVWVLLNLRGYALVGWMHRTLPASNPAHELTDGSWKVVTNDGGLLRPGTWFTYDDGATDVVWTFYRDGTVRTGKADLKRKQFLDDAMFATNSRSYDWHLNDEILTIDFDQFANYSFEINGDQLVLRPVGRSEDFGIRFDRVSRIVDPTYQPPFWHLLLYSSFVVPFWAIVVVSAIWFRFADNLKYWSAFSSIGILTPMICCLAFATPGGMLWGWAQRANGETPFVFWILVYYFPFFLIGMLLNLLVIRLIQWIVSRQNAATVVQSS